LYFLFRIFLPLFAPGSGIDFFALDGKIYQVRTQTISFFGAFYLNGSVISAITISSKSASNTLVFSQNTHALEYLLQDLAEKFYGSPSQSSCVLQAFLCKLGTYALTTLVFGEYYLLSFLLL